MVRSSHLIAFGVSILALLVSCSVLDTEESDVFVDEELPAFVYRFDVPDSTTQDLGVTVLLAGEAGANTSFGFDRVDRVPTEGGCLLRPIVRHLERRGEGYLTIMPKWEDTLNLAASQAGWFVTSVAAAQGVMIDSTLVVR